MVQLFNAYVDVCIGLVQVYRIYCGGHSGTLSQRLHAIGAVVVSIRSSFSSSSAERHTSVILYSDYSSSERIGRRLSDVSLGPVDRLSSRKDAQSLLSYSTKRAVRFLPVHELGETVSDLDKGNVSVKLTSINVMNGPCHQSNKILTTDLDLKCTTV